MRLTEPLGPAFARRALGALDVVSWPNPATVARLALTQRARVVCVSDAAATVSVAAAAQRWRAAGLEVVGARARLLSRDTLDAFDALGVDEGVAPWLPPEARAAVLNAAGAEDALVRPLGAPVEAWTSSGVALLAPVLTCPIEPGVLDLGDVGAHGRGEGATPVSLFDAWSPAALAALERGLPPTTTPRALLVDVGGDADAVADRLAARGHLAAYFGPAHRPVPRAVTQSGALVHRFFEPQDLSDDALQALDPMSGWACAWVPYGLLSDTAEVLGARLTALRRAGFSAIAPRAHRPVPNTAAWSTWAAGARAAKHRPDDAPLSDRWWTALERCVERCVSENISPPLHPRRPHAATTLDRLQSALRRPSADTAETLEHALFSGVQAMTRGHHADLTALDAYPFAAWQGTSVRVWVEDALRARLAALHDVDPDLRRAMTHIAGAPGKRLRPILAVVQAAARGVPPSRSMPAALAIEWLHAASLMQDDLPCMDDDEVRRGGPAAHARHGEGLALLGSDALVALAFEDVAALAVDPEVGAERAARLVSAFAAALGARGLVGGQARDLALRDTQGRDRAHLAAVLDAHRGKTAPLFRLTATVGAVLGAASTEERAHAESALEAYGLAFQIVDDWLDTTGDLTRPPGSDARLRRASAATTMSREHARAQVSGLLAPLLSEGVGPLRRHAALLLERLR